MLHKACGQVQWIQYAKDQWLKEFVEVFVMGMVA